MEKILGTDVIHRVGGGGSREIRSHLDKQRKGRWGAKIGHFFWMSLMYDPYSQV